MSTLIIGFGYKARRGKDTACRHIVAKRGESHDVKHYAFADALREEVNCAIFDRWVQDHPDLPFDAGSAMRHLCDCAGVPYDTNAPVSADYPQGKQRALYQWWGTEHRRAQDPDYWIKRLAERIEREAPAYAVISDLRFANEFRFCDICIRMDRPGFEIDDGAHHISERVLDSMPDNAWHAIITATDVARVEELALWRFDFIDVIRRASALREAPLPALAR